MRSWCVITSLVVVPTMMVMMMMMYAVMTGAACVVAELRPQGATRF